MIMRTNDRWLFCRRRAPGAWRDDPHRFMRKLRKSPCPNARPDPIPPLYAVFDTRLQPAALAVGTVSVLSFLAIALSTGGYNSLINRVVIADVVALVCLLAAAALYVLRQRSA
jgi:hypothetical protein